MQLESILLVSPRPQTYYRKLEEPLEPPESAGPRRENEAPFASFQWSSRLGKPRAPRKHFLKTTHRNDKCNLCCFREDGLMPF